MDLYNELAFFAAGGLVNAVGKTRRRWTHSNAPLAAREIVLPHASEGRLALRLMPTFQGPKVRALTTGVF